MNKESKRKREGDVASRTKGCHLPCKCSRPDAKLRCNARYRIASDCSTIEYPAYAIKGRGSQSWQLNHLPNYDKTAEILAFP